jgi:hypothetical protein
VALVPACVWRISPALVVALDDRFGDPVDAYLSGAQVWLRDDGPGAITLEWRLHPVAGYRKPDGLSHHDVLAGAVYAIRSGEGGLDPGSLWDGLEAFPVDEDEVEPATLASAVSDVLGLPPDAFGLVDHTSIGDQWERSSGDLSIVDALFEQLRQ